MNTQKAKTLTIKAFQKTKRKGGNLTGVYDLSQYNKVPVETATYMITGPSSLGGDEFTRDHTSRDDVDLSGLTELAPEIARIFAKKEKGKLIFNGVTELPPETGTALEGACAVEFSGLKSISPETAASLKGVREEISLNGITSLSKEVAEAFRDCKAILKFDGILDPNNLDEEAAKILAERKPNSVNPDAWYRTYLPNMQGFHETQGHMALLTKIAQREMGILWKLTPAQQAMVDMIKGK